MFKNNARILRAWVTALSDMAYDPWWNAQDEADPIGEDKIFEISLNHLFTCDEGFYLLSNKYGVLREGAFANGKVKVEWNTTDTVESWRGTLHLTVAKRNVSTMASLNKGYFVGRQGFIWRGLGDTLNIFFRLKRGKVSGLVQQFGIVDNEKCQLECINFAQFQQDETNKHQLGYLGIYEEGKPVGHAWKGINKGWIHGRVDKTDGSFTGDNIAYIYHDLELALVGRFVNSTMVRIRELPPFIYLLLKNQPIKLGMPQKGVELELF